MELALQRRKTNGSCHAAAALVEAPILKFMRRGISNQPKAAAQSIQGNYVVPAFIQLSDQYQWYHRRKYVSKHVSPRVRRRECAMESRVYAAKSNDCIFVHRVQLRVQATFSLYKDTGDRSSELV